VWALPKISVVIDDAEIEAVNTTGRVTMWPAGSQQVPIANPVYPTVYWSSASQGRVTLLVDGATPDFGTQRQLAISIEGKKTQVLQAGRSLQFAAEIRGECSVKLVARLETPDGVVEASALIDFVGGYR
jgi:hypothetical protein